MDISIIFFLASIIIVGAVLFALIAFRKSPKPLDVNYYRAKCLEVEHQLKQNEPSSYHLAIINADKLLDRALRGRGIKGKTMGERMKCVNKVFTDRNGIWQAHKLRNEIAHEYDTKVTYKQARDALRSFRQALKDLGAI